MSGIVALRARHGELVPLVMGLPISERNKELTVRVLSGESVVDIAKHYGIGPARVRQLAEITAHKADVKKARDEAASSRAQIMREMPMKRHKSKFDLMMERHGKPIIPRVKWVRDAT